MNVINGKILLCDKYKNKSKCQTCYFKQLEQWEIKEEFNYESQEKDLEMNQSEKQDHVRKHKRAQLKSGHK